VADARSVGFHQLLIGEISSFFCSGKLLLPMKLLVEENNLLLLFTGSIIDIPGIKERVKKGY